MDVGATPRRSTSSLGALGNVIGISDVSEGEKSSDLLWHRLSLEYEGFPLHLRWPAGVDFDDLSGRFPKLFVLTHTFTFRRPDGTPEPTYNDTLANFDLTVTRSFRTDRTGQIVLIETFGGKRNYYFYVMSTFDGGTYCLLLSGQFPGYNLSETTREDPAWHFIRNYHAKYLVVT